MAGTSLSGIHPTIANLYVVLTDSYNSNHILYAYCNGTPDTTTNTYAHGCIMNQRDSGTGSLALYENVGSAVAPVWALLSTGSGSSSASNASPVYSLGSATNFGTVAGTALTFSATGITYPAGYVGATTPTGTATYGSGSYMGTAAPYAQAVLDVATLKATLIGLSGTAITTPASLETNNLSSLGAGIFAPGIYTTASAIGITAGSTITLSGAGDYVFVSTGGALTFGATSTILLTNGATAARVFWVASTDLSTTGASSTLVGNFLVRDATMASTATIAGRILASRAVTIAGVANTISIPGGTQPQVNITNLATGIAPSHVIKFAGTGTGGTTATRAYTVTGALSTDVASAVIRASTTATTIQKVTLTTDTLTIIFSADPGASTTVDYMIVRAVA